MRLGGVSAGSGAGCGGCTSGASDGPSVQSPAEALQIICHGSGGPVPCQSDNNDGEERPAVKGVRAEVVAGTRRVKDDGPAGEDIRSALGTWLMENGQPAEYRKRVLDSDNDEEIRDLPEEEQRLVRRTKVLIRSSHRQWSNARRRSRRETWLYSHGWVCMRV